MLYPENLLTTEKANDWYKQREYYKKSSVYSTNVYQWWYEYDY